MLWYGHDNSLFAARLTVLVQLEFDKVQDTAIINVARPSQLLALRCLSEEHQPYFRQLVRYLEFLHSSMEAWVSGRLPRFSVERSLPDAWYHTHERSAACPL
jgi:hypothetical protein